MRTISPIELGIAGNGVAYRNLAPAQLVEAALRRGEGTLSDTGALVVKTGKYTGRSPDDKFIVDTPAVHDEIAWGKINVPIEKAKFDAIKAKILAYLQNKELFVFDGFAGADPKYTKRFRIINELASQNLFIHQLLIRPTEEQLDSYVPDYTILAAPGFKCIPEVDGVHSEAAIIIDYEAHEVLICGSGYAGEIKKSVFSVMNYVLPKEGILSMHCSANIGDDGDSAVFFGLSGTGKTEIYGAIKFGALMENVIVDETGKPDFFDGSLTENTRVGYPIDYIPNAAIPGVGGQPKTVVFLTADAFGVIPPISKLDNDSAMYHFVSGYTSKLAGTERGITEPVTTFSTLFGAPFFPLNASVYAQMLGEKLKETGANVFLVNTGWCGGAAGTVPRMKLKYTRAMVTAALAGELDNVEYELDPIFNLNIPKSCPNVPAEILNPRNVWTDMDKYEASAKALAKKFQENFAKKYPDMPANITNAGPKAE